MAYFLKKHYWLSLSQYNLSILYGLDIDKMVMDNSIML